MKMKIGRHEGLDEEMEEKKREKEFEDKDWKEEKKEGYRRRR